MLCLWSDPTRFDNRTVDALQDLASGNENSIAAALSLFLRSWYYSGKAALLAYLLPERCRKIVQYAAIMFSSRFADVDKAQVCWCRLVIFLKSLLATAACARATHSAALLAACPCNDLQHLPPGVLVAAPACVMCLHDRQP